jgi:hypothetical protein
VSVYKYVTSKAAVRYLRSWVLRITPADQFNDPFEMRPLFELDASALLEGAPAIVRTQLAQEMAKRISESEWAAKFDDVERFSDDLVAFLMRQQSDTEESVFLGVIFTLGADNAVQAVHALRSQFDGIYAETFASAIDQLPLFSRIAQAAIHQSLPKAIGVLCLSGSGKHPLMWAHYADSHTGALLEFDESAPCFNRQRAPEDDFGKLRRVWYSDTRPSLRGSDDAFVALALTKALEWAYEQELRLLWPLSQADQTIADDPGQQIHLINVPATALKSVTLGCKAPSSFGAEVLKLVTGTGRAASIKVRRASIDDTAFALNYSDWKPEAQSP